MAYAETVEQVIAYIRDSYGAEPEFLWAATPGNAAFRNAANKKWFAALLQGLPRQVLHLPGEGTADVLNVKCDPKLIGSFLDGQRYLPAYHMNKEHWMSLVLDGSLPLEEIFPLIDLSYGLIDKKKEGKRKC